MKSNLLVRNFSKKRTVAKLYAKGSLKKVVVVSPSKECIVQSEILTLLPDAEEVPLG